MNKALIRKVAYANDFVEAAKREVTPATVPAVAVMETVLESVMTGVPATFGAEGILDLFLAYYPEFRFNEVGS